MSDEAEGKERSDKDHLPAGNPPPDEAFLARLPLALRPVAAKHGQALFTFVLNCCQASEDLTIMAQLIRAADAQQRLARVAQTVNNIALIGRAASGWTDQDVIACKADIDAALRQVVQPVASPIILPHGGLRH